MERAIIEEELKELATKLGGAWRFESDVFRGNIPLIVLTLSEARALAKKVEKE